MDQQTIDSKKAKLLDDFLSKTNKRSLNRNFLFLKKSYSKIAPSIVPGRDPFVDDVFSSRVTNLIRKAYVMSYTDDELTYADVVKKSHQMRLSDVRRIDDFMRSMKGFGLLAVQEVDQVMSKYPK